MTPPVFEIPEISSSAGSVARSIAESRTLEVFVTSVLAVLAISSPYRMERITGFLDPWSDPFASGFQLTQALIAFGRCRA